MDRKEAREVMRAVSKFTKLIIVPDTVVEYHIPDFLTEDMNIEYIDSDKEKNFPDMMSFRELVSHYDPETDSFEEVTLSDGTTVLPIYDRHLKEKTFLQIAV